MTLTTKRLLLYPVSDADMQSIIENEKDPDMKEAYAEMLGGCLADPENRIWYAVWRMQLKGEPGTVVGDFCFKGKNSDGSVEIGYGLYDGYCGHGYMTEAVTAAVAFALTQNGVTRVEAETDPDNLASQKVLTRAGFVPTGKSGAEGPRFVYEPGRETKTAPTVLEKMGDFFDSRLDIYDEHQLTCIESAPGFLRFTASLLPSEKGCRVLDLGCGTGLELEAYFSINPDAKITGIDLAPGMLGRLGEKFADRDVTLITGSYFDVPFADGYDAVVSVESLHHYTAAEKTPLYEKIYRCLVPGGAFVLTDYFVGDDGTEAALRAELIRLKAEQGLPDGEFYHFDTPLTPEHETDCLIRAGFSSVDVIGAWGDTRTLIARK